MYILQKKESMINVGAPALLEKGGQSLEGFPGQCSGSLVQEMSLVMWELRSCTLLCSPQLLLSGEAVVFPEQTIFLFPPWGEEDGQLGSTPHGRGLLCSVDWSTTGASDLQHSSTDECRRLSVQPGGLRDHCDIPQCKVFFSLFWNPQVSPGWTE